MPDTTHSRSAQVGDSFARFVSTSGECMSYGALRDDSCRDRCRSREPAGNCRRCPRRIRPILFRRTMSTLSAVRLDYSRRREVQRSPGSAEEGQVLLRWEVMLLRGSQTAQRHKRITLRLEPVQVSVAPILPPHQLARSQQERCASPPSSRPCNFVHGRNTSRFSEAADQEGEGSRD